MHDRNVDNLNKHNSSFEHKREHHVKVKKRTVLSKPYDQETFKAIFII